MTVAGHGTGSPWVLVPLLLLFMAGSGAAPLLAQDPDTWEQSGTSKPDFAEPADTADPGAVAPGDETTLTGEEAGEGLQPGRAPRPDVPSEEVIVQDQAIMRARAQVVQSLRDLGYRPKRSRNGRLVLANEVAWKPVVLLDDDGWVKVKRAPVSFRKPPQKGIWKGPLGYLVCVVDPFSCVRMGGQVVSRHKLAWAKAEVLATVDYAVDVYSDTIIQVAMQRWVQQDLPDALEALWNDGRGIYGEHTYPDPPSRRAAMLEFWWSRADNEWGERSRQVVRDFMEFVVQPSEHPFTVDEIRHAQERAPQGVELSLPPAGQ